MQGTVLRLLYREFYYLSLQGTPIKPVEIPFCVVGGLLAVVVCLTSAHVCLLYANKYFLRAYFLLNVCITRNPAVAEEPRDAGVPVEIL